MLLINKKNKIKNFQMKFNNNLNRKILINNLII